MYYICDLYANIWKLIFPENSLTRSYKGYKLLCEFRGGNNKSVCEEAYDSLIATIIQNVYLDPPSSKPYAFRSSPPNLDGQIGVPSIVDKILGKVQLKTFYYFSKWVKYIYRYLIHELQNTILNFRRENRRVLHRIWCIWWRGNFK